MTGNMRLSSAYFQANIKKRMKAGLEMKKLRSSLCIEQVKELQQELKVVTIIKAFEKT